ncbi:MBL fold metallo-hydrolase [Salibacterium halotolerans]|uniref:Glyoxylase, beta-lactamase superfamily II n=1 Tax=Salibacterium halotolerans TaxID=1884432 RepID=A0A1I5VZF2_9BACI|nr:MBL fold metallo-hydrolase [Salibacterium halotolerans]SFQ12717.1 Glyoxylase, beta-lactamase superfamily II [Salibacterium halotolerans]
MRITKLNNIYQLAFMPRFFPVNCYLVEEEEYLTLIDAGLSFSKKAILKTAAYIGKPIRKIVLTHVHSDHIGALDGLKEELLDDVEVLLPKREAKLLTGDLSLEKGEGNRPVKGGIPKNITTRPDTLLVDGNQIGSLSAIHSPGHTPGMMAFLDIRNNSLIAGDAFQTRGGMAVSGDMRWRFPFPTWATWNKEVAIDSAERLLNYKPSLLAVGHGDLIIDPEKKMVQAIEGAKNY